MADGCSALRGKGDEPADAEAKKELRLLLPEKRLATLLQVLGFMSWWEARLNFWRQQGSRLDQEEGVRTGEKMAARGGAGEKARRVRSCGSAIPVGELGWKAS